MDEFDKICTPSYSANHGDVHLEVQHNLLTLVEGSRVETKQGYVNTNKAAVHWHGFFRSVSEKRKNDSKRSRLDLEQVEVMKLWKLNMRLR